MPTCKKCDVGLDDSNWYPTDMKRGHCVCKTCANGIVRKWRRENRDEYRKHVDRHSRKIGHVPMGENKKCTMYLGCHVAERVLRNIFKDVKQMPNCNHGYDFICNRGKKIDVKSSCTHHRNHHHSWLFHIEQNTVADFFLCVAFDDRKNLNPLHLWLIPGHKINHVIGTSISQSTIHKWDEYALDIEKVTTCCNILRGE